MQIALAQMTEYHSCVHVAQSKVHSGIKHARELASSRRLKLLTTYYCVECDFCCSFNDTKLQKHAADTGHVICIRNKEPAELFCLVCKDFQFSSVFDKLFRRKRTLTGALYGKSKMLGGAAPKVVKGLCNMGATCFMSAVLQVLMKNAVLMACDQLQQPWERCKTVIERSVSLDNTSRQSGDSSGAAVASCASCIYCEFKKLSADACREESSDALIPANLLYAVWNELDYMAGYQQQDAHEFLIAFLDGIDKHLRTNHATGNAGGLSVALPNPLQTNGYAAAGLEHSPVMRKSPRSESKPRPFTSGGSWTSPPLLRRSLSENEPTSTGSVHAVTQCAEVLDVFRGSLQSNLTCRCCGHESVKQEAFLDLSLSLTHCGSIASSPRKPAVGAAGETPNPVQTLLPVPTPDATQSSSNTAFGAVTEDIAAVEVVPAVEIVPAVVVPVLPRTRGRKAKNASAVTVPATPAVAPAPPVSVEPTPAASTPAPKPACVPPPADAPTAEASSSQTGTAPMDLDAEEIALSDCLRSFTTLENLGEKIYCEHCCASQDMQKQFFIAEPPNVLILHLKRFDVLTDTKITTKVNIPLSNFDIAEFTGVDSGLPGGSAAGRQAGSLQTSPPCGASVEDTVYDLQGVVSHSGTLHGGHYIAYALDLVCGANGAVNRKQWIRCDDESVAVVSEEEVLEADAYVLFYTKKKLLTNSCR